jgi:hypothetical protein
MRDDGRYSRRGRPTRGIEHQQQLHQVFLHRRRQRLDDEDVSLTAVGFQLDAKTIVAEPARHRGAQAYLQLPADGFRQLNVGVSAKNNNHAITNLVISSFGHLVIAGQFRDGANPPTMTR